MTNIIGSLGLAVLGLASFLATPAGIATAAGSAEVFVAGLAPDRHPEGAPRIRAVAHPQAWYAHALTGVTPPYPHSLFFLDAQGDWYSPFVVPGMVGRYDIRGWHAREVRRP